MDPRRGRQQTCHRRRRVGFDLCRLLVGHKQQHVACGRNAHDASARPRACHRRADARPCGNHRCERHPQRAAGLLGELQRALLGRCFQRPRVPADGRAVRRSIHLGAQPAGSDLRSQRVYRRDFGRHARSHALQRLANRSAVSRLARQCNCVAVRSSQPDRGSVSDGRDRRQGPRSQALC
eukprot:Amastigsp_a343124_17.p3 type:complete len:180 gc:universal Amastigsp_a343124_17:880-341(-)